MILLWYRLAAFMEWLSERAERAGLWFDLQRVRAIDKRNERDDLFMQRPAQTSKQYFQKQVDLWNGLVRESVGHFVVDVGVDYTITGMRTYGPDGEWHSLGCAVHQCAAFPCTCPPK